MKKLLLALFTIAALQASAQVPQLIYDILPGINGSTPCFATVYNGKLYFAAADGINGRELWVYDGLSNPSIAYNINSGSASSFSLASTVRMAELNSKLYFAADNGTAGSELMMYDGVNPPSLVYNIYPGSGGSLPYDLRAIGSKIFFMGIDGSAGTELFVYDGVSAPVMFDLYPGASSSTPVGFTQLNSKVYFRAGNPTAGAELFVYDPGTNSATLAYDIEPGSTSSSPNNKIYFTATTAAYGLELYSYDGTTATRLTDINTGPGNSISGKLEVYNNKIYFSGSASVGDYQLYKYDPSNNIASLVYTIYPGNNSSISSFQVYGNKLYFNASNAAYGNELWMHDGTATSMVADIYTGTFNSLVTDFVVYNGKLYFTAANGTAGTELFSFTDTTLSVQNTKLDGTVTIMPNPTTGDATLQLSLNTPTTLSMQVTDIAGKLVSESKTTHYTTGTNNISVPLSGKSSGTYYYRLTGTEGTLMSSGKIIKQ